MGNAPAKKGDPENGIITFAGASVITLTLEKNLLSLCFCCLILFFPAVKAFLTEAKEEFNAKWERPSQVRLSRYEL